MGLGRWDHVGPRPPGKFGSVSPSHMELLPDAEKADVMEKLSWMSY